MNQFERFKYGLYFILQRVNYATYNDPRILGLSLYFEEKSVLLLNLYFPTTGLDGDDKFSHYMGKK